MAVPKLQFLEQLKGPHFAKQALTSRNSQRIVNLMEGTGHFDRLVSGLSLDERAKLLEKLGTQSNLANTSLYEDAPDDSSEQMEIRYGRLPWYYKLFFFILSFFNNRKPLKLYEDYLMSKMGRELENKTPGFYNFQKDMLLAAFQVELVNLRDGSRFFYSALDASLNRDKGGLMVFLGSLEMPEIHKSITAKTDPQSLASKYPDLNEVELRQRAFKEMEDAIGGMSEEQRNAMYKNARSLYCLKQLSSFLFDRVINTFIFDSTVQGNICPAASVRDQLLVLNNILFSLKEVPPMALLESLFVFVLMEQSGESGFDIQNEMRKLLSKAEASLKMIRDFNQQVPLTILLRCMSRNMNIKPQNIGGGEDWFALYREHWKMQVDGLFTEFIRTRRQRDLQNSFKYFFKGTNLKFLENVRSDSNPLGFSVRGSYGLSFLQTFYSAVFMGEINKIIRPILIDGEFHKRENRAEFTECYNNLIKLEDLIKRFDRDISPAGDYGKRYAQAKADMSSLPVKRRRVQLVVEDAVRDSTKILSQTREAMQGMVRVLGGITGKNKDEKYDTLSNLSHMGRGTSFAEALEGCIEQFNRAIKLMEEIDAMEAGR
jgi:hypothetical protein